LEVLLKYSPVPDAVAEFLTDTFESACLDVLFSHPLQNPEVEPALESLAGVEAKYDVSICIQDNGRCLQASTTDPLRVADAVLWRDVQREILKKYRCLDPRMKIQISCLVAVVRDKKRKKGQ
jgi:hypothetical protein